MGFFNWVGKRFKRGGSGSAGETLNGQTPKGGAPKSGAHDRETPKARMLSVEELERELVG